MLVATQPSVNPVTAASGVGLAERVASVVGLSAMVGLLCFA